MHQVEVITGCNDRICRMTYIDNRERGADDTREAVGGCMDHGSQTQHQQGNEHSSHSRNTNRSNLAADEYRDMAGKAKKKKGEKQAEQKPSREAEPYVRGITEMMPMEK